MSFETLTVDSDYEICTEYPFTIRRKDNGYEPSESYNNKGYIQVNLNRKNYGKHVVVASQWIENDDPEHKTQVDHINHDRTDYHIENLRWVTPSQNSQNRSSHRGVKYEFVDELPLDVIPIILYKKWEFESYFIDKDGNVWFDNGEQFRKLYVNTYNGFQYINMTDIYHKRHKISINGLRRDLI